MRHMSHKCRGRARRTELPRRAAALAQSALSNRRRSWTTCCRVLLAAVVAAIRVPARPPNFVEYGGARHLRRASEPARNRGASDLFCYLRNRTKRGVEVALAAEQANMRVVRRGRASPAATGMW